MNGLQICLIIASVLSAVAGATAQLTDLFGASTAHIIVSAVTFANTILTAVMTPLVGTAAQLKNVGSMTGVKVKVDATASPEVAALAIDPKQPNIGAVSAEARAQLQQIAKLIIILAFIVIATPAFAQKKPPSIFQPRTDATDSVQFGGPSDNKGLQDLIGALDAKLLPDLKYAKRLADKAGNKITGDCWGTWISIIESRQSAVQDDQGQPVALPDPAVITKFEQLVELRNQLQPTSDFVVKCSPVAQMVKRDLVRFIGVVITGGVGLATLIPGL